MPKRKPARRPEKGTPKPIQFRPLASRKVLQQRLTETHRPHSRASCGERCIAIVVSSSPAKLKQIADDMAKDGTDEKFLDLLIDAHDSLRARTELAVMAMARFVYMSDNLRTDEFPLAPFGILEHERRSPKDKRSR